MLKYIMTLIDFDKAQNVADARTMLVGIDEAGRGPLAGPVTACACYIPPELYTHPIMSKINDSKKLTPQKREMIFAELITLPIIYCTGYASAAEIDKLNILQATFLAMRRGLAKFKNKNISVLIDGNKTIPNLTVPQKAIVKGDGTSLCIAAASIIAKVSRDKFMDISAKIYPNYKFEEHKGYGTKLHTDLIEKYGPCPLHRKTFEPIYSKFYGLFADCNFAKAGAK